MKFGIRKPSLKRRIAARTSVKTDVRHSLGLKAPRGWGWITNPRKAAYNRIYNRTSLSADSLLRGKRRKSLGCPCCGAYVFSIFAAVIACSGHFLSIRLHQSPPYQGGLGGIFARGCGSIVRTSSVHGDKVKKCPPSKIATWSPPDFTCLITLDW